MASNALIAFFAALGVSIWVYSKFARSTGGNMSSTLIVTGSAAVVIFLIALGLLSLIPQ